MLLLREKMKFNFTILNHSTNNMIKEEVRISVKHFAELAIWYQGIDVDKTIPDVPMKSGEITHFEDGEYNPN